MQLWLSNIRISVCFKTDLTDLESNPTLWQYQKKLYFAAPCFDFLQTLQMGALCFHHHPFSSILLIKVNSFLLMRRRRNAQSTACGLGPSRGNKNERQLPSWLIRTQQQHAHMHTDIWPVISLVADWDARPPPLLGNSAQSGACSRATKRA